MENDQSLLMQSNMVILHDHTINIYNNVSVHVRTDRLLVATPRDSSHRQTELAKELARSGKRAGS